MYINTTTGTNNRWSPKIGDFMQKCHTMEELTFGSFNDGHWSLGRDCVCLEAVLLFNGICMCDCVHQEQNASRKRRQ